MAIRKIFYRTDDGGSFTGDVIEYGGKSWLVPQWLKMPNRPCIVPSWSVAASAASVVP